MALYNMELCIYSLLYATAAYTPLKLPASQFYNNCRFIEFANRSSTDPTIDKVSDVHAFIFISKSADKLAPLS